MGYRIEYPGPEPKVPAETNTRMRIRGLIAAVFFTFALTVRLLWPEGTEYLREAFLPVELSATEAAFSQLVADLQDGNTLGYSVDVFCRSIINEAS